MKSAVLLDLDETLIPDSGATSAALVATAREAGLTARLGIEPEAVAAAVREHARALWLAGPRAPYCQAIGISASEGLWGDLDGDDPNLRALAGWAPIYRHQAWAGALAALGAPDADLAASLAVAYPAHRSAQIALFPEVDAVLRRLGATRGLAIVTNGAPRLQRAKIAAAGLADRGMAVIVSGELGVGKPDPRVLAAALTALGADPTAAVMVGDAPERDVAGARAAGVMAVWINRFGHELGLEEPRPDATIASLDELVALV
jgi:putative hydrolase of the HAD superfamily